MKNYVIKLVMVVLAVVMLIGCSNNTNKTSDQFSPAEKVITINRESGSGTKISFLGFLSLKETELNEQTENIVSSTDVMLSAVEDNQYAIGYTSSSKLSPGVKAICIDEFMPTKENVISGKYSLTRDLSLVTKNEVSDVTQDFLGFILANSGIIEECGYISNNQPQSYTSKKPNGEIRISGSSSVYPLMEKLIESYKSVNPNAEIEINETDSSNGIANVQNEITHIAMSSRKLTQEELVGTKQVVIAKDTIAVIVNGNNPVENITLEQLKQIYTGKLNSWNEVK